jgi:Ser/Thr protein kinase RdoA (MazF antagonist)
VIDAERIVRLAWSDYGDNRSIVEIVEVSAHVSTNHVFRLHLDDGSHVVGKVSSYGSYFLFAEDHDRLFKLVQSLSNSRWSGFLAQVLPRDGRAYTWYDGSCWAAFYNDVERGTQLPRIISTDDIVFLAREIAGFHKACANAALDLPSTSNSVKGDAIHLLDQLSSEFAPRNFDLRESDISYLRTSTHNFLTNLENIHFDEWKKIPILVDWNLGNFSVTQDANLVKRLFTRWDYDWFRIDTRMLDFYFLSRAASHTGDKTHFSYSPHTLVEPRFVAFLQAYHSVYPLSRAEIEFLPSAYQFFILNYVIREGAKFFRADLSTRFRKDAVRQYLPMLESLDISPLLQIVD